MHHSCAAYRILSVVLSVLILAASLPISAMARTAGTVTGSEETIVVSKDSGQSAREANFNADWKFYLGNSGSAQNPSFDDSGWDTVQLPHDFSISQSFTTSGEAESGFLPGGTGWYRKHFVLPESSRGKTILLNFDGVYADAYVYVNGTKVGENHYGYSSFAMDITDELVCDGHTENVVAVKAVHNVPTSRWYSGSGIYRDVTLITTDPLHVELYGTTVQTPDIASGRGTVRVKTEVRNDGSAADFTVKNTVLDAAGRVVAEASSTASAGAGKTVAVTNAPVVSDPQLWSTETPTLYTVRTEIITGGETADTCDTTFGFRWYSFGHDGFKLNGENLKLNGVCLHHDNGALGSAAYEDADRRKLSIMKEMGCNAIRTSHNPADRRFIEICNELGLLVIEEFFDGWNVAKNKNYNDFSQYFNANLSTQSGLVGGNSSMTWAEFAVKSTVRRDRNAPAVILWSLGNEIQEGASTSGEFPSIARNLIQWAEEEDSTRPTTIGDNTRGGNGTLNQVMNTITSNGGIAGYNYAGGGELDHLADQYGVIIASETSSAVNSRGIYSTQTSRANADGRYHLTSYDTSAVTWGITAHESMWNTLTRDNVAGEFVWTGFDYIGEPTPWNGTSTGSVSGSGAIPNSSYFGIVETTGFEKDTYYLYRSQWKQDDVTLHLVTAWDSANMLQTGRGNSRKTPVVIYSNAPVVKLYRGNQLIGTATRTVHTTGAGHAYYTYRTASENSSICSAVSASGSESLYATFNVAYQSGTLRAEACGTNGKPLNVKTTGRSEVTTPGAAARLVADASRKTADADGSSLTYITVDVTDAQGNPDTTATQNIRFSLSGNGEIVGVDNGDQATTNKYQQRSVLNSPTSANIDAYAGKALVIVRSTRDAGSFTVNVSSSNLDGDSVTVQTLPAGDTTAAEGLVSYTMVKDYTVKTGTRPELLTTARGTMADGTEVNGTIVWEPLVQDVYTTPGDKTITGTLTFAGEEPIAVTCRLHVIADVIALRNISAVTTPNTVPTLADTVSGVLPDGTRSGEFKVEWEPMTASQFAVVGDFVTVHGTAAVFDTETLPVTASVRVAEAVNTESVNIASTASSLEEDCQEVSDNLESIRDGVWDDDRSLDARWTNYNNRNRSSTAAITFRWDTAQLISSVNLYYFTDSYSASLPENVRFEYSLDGSNFNEVTYTGGNPSGGFAKTTYTFDRVVNPIALRIVLTERAGRCVGLTEAEVMTYAGRLEVNSSAALSAISVDGTPLDDFTADKTEYTAAGSVVTAASEQNAGITVLPAVGQVVRILTVSEDGSDARTYTVTLTGAVEECTHERTVRQGEKAPTCTEPGYTGDLVCADCGKVLEQGTVIPAAGHQTERRNAAEPTCTEDGYTGDLVCTVCGETVERGEVIPAAGHKTERRGAVEATCTTAGYTGDEVCTVCGKVISEGKTIAPLGHQWDNGKIIRKPTTTQPGERLYTCTRCGETRTEEIPVLTSEAPSAGIRAERSGKNKIKFIGQFVDYEHADRYYEVVSHGLVYCPSFRMGSRVLTVDTPGRSRVNFGAYHADGTYTYQITPRFRGSRYTVRAFLEYVDPVTGKTGIVYSDQISVSYNNLG